MNGILGRKARLTSEGTASCAPSERERMNFARAATVDPFLVAAHVSSAIDLTTRAGMLIPRRSAAHELIPCRRMTDMLKLRMMAHMLERTHMTTIENISHLRCEL